MRNTYPVDSPQCGMFKFGFILPPRVKVNISKNSFNFKIHGIRHSGSCFIPRKMTIHLIKSAEVFTTVYDLLTAMDGTISFKCDPASVINFSQEELFSRFYDDVEAFSKMTDPPFYSLMSLDSRKLFPTHDSTACFRIMNSLHLKLLYTQNFRQHAELSELYIDPRNNKIYLPGFSNIEINLRPFAKAKEAFFAKAQRILEYFNFKTINNTI
jgi:hypothetical protein